MNKKEIIDSIKTELIILNELEQKHSKYIYMPKLGVILYFLIIVMTSINNIINSPSIELLALICTLIPFTILLKRINSDLETIDGKDIDFNYLRYELFQDDIMEYIETLLNSKKIIDKEVDTKNLKKLKTIYKVLIVISALLGILIYVLLVFFTFKNNITILIIIGTVYFATLLLQRYFSESYLDCEFLLELEKRDHK